LLLLFNDAIYSQTFDEKNLSYETKDKEHRSSQHSKTEVGRMQLYGQNQGWAIAHSLIAHFRSLQKSN